MFDHRVKKLNFTILSEFIKKISTKIYSIQRAHGYTGHTLFKQITVVNEIFKFIHKYLVNKLSITPVLVTWIWRQIRTWEPMGVDKKQEVKEFRLTTKRCQKYYWVLSPIPDGKCYHWKNWKKYLSTSRVPHVLLSVSCLVFSFYFQVKSLKFMSEECQSTFCWLL